MVEPTGNVGPSAEEPKPNSPDQRPSLQEFPEATPDRAEDPTGYKPFALLAVIGFGGAALFALVLLLLVVFSLLRRSPPSMPWLTLIWPLAAGLLSLAGWLQIRRSEGTRAGGALAFWGLLLSALCGLGYCAYMLASSLAINTQAEPVVAAWFDLMKKDDTEQAFLLTLAPDQRRDFKDLKGAELRAALESRPLGGSERFQGPPLQEFVHSDLYQRLAQAGDKAKITSHGVTSSEYKDNGYLLRYRFQVELPEGQFDTVVIVFGQEGKGGAGRQWMIRQKESGIDPNSRQPSDLGMATNAVTQAGRSFMSRWVDSLKQGDRREAYLATLKPEERAGFNVSQEKFEDDPGFQAAFHKGGLVQVTERFWAPADMRKDVEEAVKAPLARRILFMKPDKESVEGFLTVIEAQQSLPRWWVENDRLIVAYPVEFKAYGLDANRRMVPRAVIHGSIVLETNASALDDPKQLEGWRVVRIELTRGGEPPAPLTAPPLPKPGP